MLISFLALDDRVIGSASDESRWDHCVHALILGVHTEAVTAMSFELSIFMPSF